MPDDAVSLVPESSLDRLRVTADWMVDHVAGMIGASDDPDDRDIALSMLDRAADHLNLSGIFLYRQKTKTYSSLTEGQETLELPSDWAWPEDPVLTLDSDNETTGKVQWVRWSTLEELIDRTAKNGVPSYIAVRSQFDDTAKIFPFIDASDVSRIDMAYVARIPHPSEEEELHITPETREALTMGGEAYFMRRRYKDKPNIWRPFWAGFLDAITKAKAAAHRYQQTVNVYAQPDIDGRTHALSTAFSSRGGTAYLPL